MIHTAHRFDDEAAFLAARNAAPPLAVDVIGVAFAPGVYDEAGSVITAPEPLPGYHVNAVWAAEPPEPWAASRIPAAEAPRWWSGVPREPIVPVLDAGAIEALINARVEAVARSMGYNGTASCASYVNSTVPKWAAEAAAFVAWRDAVWLEVVARKDKAPPTTEAEVIALLPAFVRPES